MAHPKFFSSSASAYRARAVLAIAASLGTSGALQAQAPLQFSHVGQHPTSTLTPYPGIMSLKAFRGRLYMGYGDYTDYPPIALVSYDPAVHAFRIEHFAHSDAVDALVEIDGTLIVPHVDPAHYEMFRDYTLLEPGWGWRDAAPFGNYHVYDAEETANGWMLCGSRDNSVRTLGGQYDSFLTRDQGTLWTGVEYTSDRFYGMTGDGSGFISYVSDAKSVRTGNGWSLARYARSTGSLSTSVGNLMSHSPNGTTYSSTLANWHSVVGDFTVVGSQVYALLSSTSPAQIATTTFTGPANYEPWVEWPTLGLPASGLTAMEVLGAKVYVADASGQLWAAALDGSAPAGVPEAGVIDELATEFGRGLAVQPGTVAGTVDLFVGEPGAGRHVPAAGRGWKYAGLDPAAPTVIPQLLEPDVPTQRFAAFYGRQAAFSGEWLAVMEPCRDSTGADRSSHSRVWLYRSGVLINAFNVPYSQTVAFSPRGSAVPVVLVASANAAADQSSGQGSVHAYQVDGTKLSSSKGSIAGGSPPYKPTSRVIETEGWLVAGHAGDPSREGGPGYVSVFGRATTGAGFATTPAQTLLGTGGDQFGFALAAQPGWLAVGAPRAEGVSPDSGAVSLYQFTPGAAAPAVFSAKLTCPADEPEAAFGSSLAMDGDWLAVGAPGVSEYGRPRTGAVFLYKRSGTTWTLAARVSPPRLGRGAFGISTALANGWLFAGCRWEAGTAADPLGDRLRILQPGSLGTGLRQWMTDNNLTSTDLSNDPDSDGAGSLAEYAMATSPHSFDPVGFTPQLSTDGKSWVISLTVVDDPLLQLGIESSSDLLTWSSLPTTSIAPEGTNRLRLSFSSPAAPGGRFFRLRATVTLNTVP